MLSKITDKQENTKLVLLDPYADNEISAQLVLTFWEVNKSVTISRYAVQE